METVSQNNGKYIDLEREIRDLKLFADPLEEEMVISPIMSVISRITSMPEYLDDLTQKRIDEIQREVTECQRILESISYNYVKSLLAKPKEGRVFRILNNANIFNREVRKRVGKKVEMDGEEIVITPKLVEALTRYRFSLGTPPVTPEAMETIEKILFSDSLQSIYTFRDLLSTGSRGRIVFDKFLSAIDEIVVQSTHYTTAEEKKKMESEASEYPNREGLRGLKKTIVSGTSKTAIRLIKEHLLSQHSNGTRPLHEVVEVDRLDDSLIEEMKAAKEKMFIVRVKNVAHNTLTSSKFHEKWKGVIGRLIIIDESKKSERSSITFVYSINPLFKERLEKFHVKDSGTPANTQMNLRSILEKVPPDELHTLKEQVEKKIQQIEKNGSDTASPSEARKKEWTLREQKDLLSLRKFLQFIEFIEKITGLSDEDFKKMASEMMKENEELTMKYFFSALEGKGYECISVPQGGGRRELGLIGKFHKKKSDERVKKFKDEKLEVVRENVKRLEVKLGVTSTDAERNALARALSERGGPNQELRNVSGNTGSVKDAIRNRFESFTHSLAAEGSQKVDALSGLIESLAATNLPGEIKARIEERLKGLDIGAASKLMEMGRFRKAGNSFRDVVGSIGRTTGNLVGTIDDTLRKIRVGMEPQSLELVNKLISDIDANDLGPRMALPKMAWTFSDVMNENDYGPEGNIKIELDANGELNLSSLEQKLIEKEEQLYLFPELFQLYCSTILLIVNDPHNPTSRVASNQTKLKLLDIASRFNLTICSDEAYRKQISKAKKSKQGDGSLSEFYEQNRSRFPNAITINTSMPVTKWAIAGGERIGTIVTNDKSGEMREFVESNIDGVNIMSLYMSNNTLRTGDLAKVVCKLLYTGTLGANTEQAIDGILKGYFGNLKNKNFNAPIYFALIQARNQLDLLKVRTETTAGYIIERSKFTSKLITNLKRLRLDKVTQKDVEERTKAAVGAIQELGIDAIMPEGPFYMCVKLDETGQDTGLIGFLEEIAKSMKIEVVPQPDGYVRLSFGGMVDGTPKGYKMLQLAIKTELTILLKYWKEYKELRAKYSEEKVTNPSVKALRKLLPGGEKGIVQAKKEKEEFISAMETYEEGKRGKLTFDHDANLEELISKIEAGAPAHIVTIRGVTCRSAEEFVNSKSFKDLFNHYLQMVKDRIPELQHLTKKQLIRKYGAQEVANKYQSNAFANNERDVFAKIMIMVSNIWFSHDTMKVLTGGSNEMDLKGIEATVSSFIKEVIDVFVPEKMQGEIKIRPTFQVGYSSLDKATACEGAPKWMGQMVEMDGAEFISTSSATDRSPEMKTGASTRVPGHEYQIFRRDGDGVDKPEAKHFTDRLNQFTENLNPKDYVFKMIQIGPSKVLTITHRSYSHYLAEELRLFPQFEVKPKDLKNLRPDCVSFLGIPPKVMGEDFRIGYFMDKYDDGTQIPVSWVDRESITDYMGYLKKPILTVANEKMKEKEITPIHGGAFTVIFKNGLRKTVILGGDSGTGKSETLIAMVEQIMKGIGVAEEVESVELLAGDMLCAMKGDDKEMYMLGTEQGDFMRMTDISANWKERRQDLVNTGSKTNLDSDTNPRITVGDICNPTQFLVPVRFNMFLNISNYEVPPGQSSFRETKNPKNLMQEYLRGYRGEKGTSGDQPNIHGSLLNTKDKDIAALLIKYKETFDNLLGWNIEMSKTGKAKNAVLRFKDVEGEVYEAKKMVHDLFVGKSIGEEQIISTRLDAQSGEFYVTLKDASGKKRESKLLRNEIFAKIFNSVASTYCGNPFVDPVGMDKIIEQFGKDMQSAGIITGTLYTQLKIPGMEFEGPERAAQSLVDFMISDERIIARFQKQKKEVNAALRDAYGDHVIQSGSLPLSVEKWNLHLYERQTSDQANPVNSKGEIIDIETPHYKSNARNSRSGLKPKFKPSLATQEVHSTIENICSNEENQHINLSDYTFNTDDYFKMDGSKVAKDSKIRKWNNPQELIYQILILNGIIELGSKEGFLYEQIEEVMKAQKIAEAIIKATRK